MYHRKKISNNESSQIIEWVITPPQKKKKKNSPLFIPVGGGESWWLHVNILHSKVALFQSKSKEYILPIYQPTQNWWSPRNTRDLALTFALKQVRSEKEPEEKLPKDVGMGVCSWVLNILVSFCLFGCTARHGGPSLPNRDGPHTPPLEAWSLNHQTDREVPWWAFWDK